MQPHDTPYPRAIKSPTGVVVVVTGDRHATLREWGPIIDGALYPGESLKQPAFLIHGDQGYVDRDGVTHGIDTIASQRAKKMGFTPVPMPAQWTKYGKPAGPRRNTAMVNLGLTYQDHGYYVVVLAFHNSLDTSRGTGDMVRKSRAAGLHVRVFTSEGEVR